MSGIEVSLFIIEIIIGIPSLIGFCFLVFLWFRSIGSTIHFLIQNVKEKNYKDVLEVVLVFMGIGVIFWAIAEYASGNIATMFIVLLLLIPIGLLLYTSFKNK